MMACNLSAADSVKWNCSLDLLGALSRANGALLKDGDKSEV